MPRGRFREFDGALGGPNCSRDARQCDSSIDQHLDPIARAGREPMRSDVRRTRIQGGLPADPSQATAMMSSHRALDRVPEGRVDTSERVRETRR